jgi:hypothetical protein
LPVGRSAASTLGPLPRTVPGSVAVGLNQSGTERETQVTGFEVYPETRSPAAPA